MKKNIILTLGILMFLASAGLAVRLESTVFLYISSILPLFIVPFLPDVGTHQYIKPAKQSDQVEIIRPATDSGPSGLLLIRFQPGFVKWNKKMLYFSLKDISAYPTLPIREEYTASLSVLKYDLKPHPTKKGWIGIRIPHLLQRMEQLSYTTQEINRLVIRMEDLQELASLSLPSTPSRQKSVQA
jgi:hypothetical protein